jgi:hypothetical protein
MIDDDNDWISAVHSAIKAKVADAPAGAPEDRLATFEARTGLAIPRDLREILKRVNGVVLGSGKALCGVESVAREADVDTMYRKCPEWLMRSWIPLAISRNGRAFVVGAGKGQAGEVYEVDTSVQPSELLGEAAPDLATFLRLWI